MTQQKKNPTTKAFPKQTPVADAGKSAKELIDQRIHELGDWRGELLGRLRALIKSVDAAIVEEWKWSVPVWSQGGIICTGESYKKAVKLTFAKGAALPDPAGLFNASLDGNVRRAIDFTEGSMIDEKALIALIQAAISHNQATAKASKKAEA